MKHRSPFLSRRQVLAGALGYLTSGLSTAEAAADGGSSAPVRFLLEWGKAGSAPGEFDFPIGIAVNRWDEVLVSDHYNHRVQKFNRNGKLLTTFNVLSNPGGICVDHAGNVYLTHFAQGRMGSEKMPDRVSVYDRSGHFLREWGKSGKGDGDLDYPGGITIGPNGHVYVADQTNRRVEVFDREGKFRFKWGEYGARPGQFGGLSNPRSRVGGPQFLAFDSRGQLYTTEAAPGRIQKFTAEGTPLRAWGDNEDRPGSFGGYSPAAPGSLRGPIGLCIDRKDRLWISTVRGRIQLFTGEGKLLCGFGEKPGSGPGEFLAPHGIALDSRGDLYVADAYNQRVQKFSVPK